MLNNLLLAINKPTTPPVPITTPGIYHSASLGLISLSSDGTNRYTIADKNLGATQAWNYGNQLTSSNVGNWFQRGNNNFFQWDESPYDTGKYTLDQVDATSYGPGNYYSSDIFYKGSGSPYNPHNRDLWGGVTDTDIAKQGPCQEGFHVPSVDEWNNIKSLGRTLGAWGSNDGADLVIYLMIPYSGFLSGETLSVSDVGNSASFWTATSANDLNANTFWVSDTFISQDDRSGYPSHGIAIRPFKNTPVIPTTRWEVLYQ